VEEIAMNYPSAIVTAATIIGLAIVVAFRPGVPQAQAYTQSYQIYTAAPDRVWRLNVISGTIALCHAASQGKDRRSQVVCGPESGAPTAAR
jgi:hypothetical protein